MLSVCACDAAGRKILIIPVSHHTGANENKLNLICFDPTHLIELANHFSLLPNQFLSPTTRNYFQWPPLI